MNFKHIECSNFEDIECSNCDIQYDKECVESMIEKLVSTHSLSQRMSHYLDIQIFVKTICFNKLVLFRFMNLFI